ncbi:hypothetical protein AB0B50_09370 [Streptomyces sp. NPDC041068]|uniref:hypothetical protein n=1 Tax=Streptomyces sp. NPDC041068 TaxID=3155130 RepID=UPI0033E642AD
MSTGQKTVSIFLTLIGALLVLILGLCLDWPLWVWPTAAAVLAAALAVAASAATRARRRDPFPPGTVPDQPIAPVERREVYVDRISLPSQLADYDFLFSATIRWCPADSSADVSHINAGALAMDAVIERARAVTSCRKPFRSSLVQHELSGALGIMETDPGGHIRAMALDVALVLPEEDQQRLERLAAIRKNEDLWEHERNYERNKREYLGGDVLRDTGSAVVWWLAKNDDHVEKAVNDIGLLARLTSAANNEEVAEPFRHLIPESFPPITPLETEPPTFGNFGGFDEPTAREGTTEPSAAETFADFVRRLGRTPGDEECLLLAEQVAMNIEDWDGETADEIRRRFAARTAAAGMASPQWIGTGTARSRILTAPPCPSTDWGPALPKESRAPRPGTGRLTAPRPSAAPPPGPSAPT